MQKTSQQEAFDSSFYVLANQITRALERNKDGTIQQEQVEELTDAERKFKALVLKYKNSTWVYQKFLQKVCVQNKNILSARPYFRETAVTFSKKITPAIKAEDIDTLKTFNINYQFIKFIKDSWHGKWPDRAEQLFQRVQKARIILIENNMPLAINRAKLFYRKTPKSHLTLIDFINICAMGLGAGVDKYCGPYSPVFRGVCIGRMVGNMIDSYSETMIHFYPSDKRILYRAHSIRGRRGIDDIVELTKAVNDSFKQDQLEGKSIPKGTISVSELSSLMSAASMVSADATVNEEGFGVYHFTEDSDQDVEKSAIHKETMSQLGLAIKKLPLLQRKVILLKGVKI